MARYFYLIECDNGISSPIILSDAIYVSRMEAKAAGRQYAAANCRGVKRVDALKIRKNVDTFAKEMQTPEYQFKLKLMAAEDRVWQKRRNPDGVYWALIALIIMLLIAFLEKDLNPFVAWGGVFLASVKASKKFRWWFFPK